MVLLVILLFTGDLEEAIRLLKYAYQIFKDSKCIALDDTAMETIRMGLGYLLQEVGR